jgi:hypothetical protein
MTTHLISVLNAKPKIAVRVIPAPATPGGASPPAALPSSPAQTVFERRASTSTKLGQQ